MNGEPLILKKKLNSTKFYMTCYRLWVYDMENKVMNSSICAVSPFDVPSCIWRFSVDTWLILSYVLLPLRDSERLNR